VQSYRKLMATTRAVLRAADTMVRRLDHRRRTARAGAGSVLARAQRQLRQLRPLVQRVVTQTRACLMGGDTHVPDKVSRTWFRTNVLQVCELEHGRDGTGRRM
jgi:hypothetical protein